MRKIVAIHLLTASIFLWSGVGLYGQTPKSGGARSVDVAPIVSRLVEPDSPGNSATTSPGLQAVVPRLIKFSGALHDGTGKPLSGTVDVTFSLYSTEAGGNPLWFETQSVQADELGQYTALLGAMHTEGLPIDLFTSGEVRWLGIQVGLEAEQQPRVLLVSVPYALKAGDAETLGGKPASAYMLSDLQNGSNSTNGPPPSTATTTVDESGKGPAKTRAATTSPLVAACIRVGSDSTAVLNSIAMFTANCEVGGSPIFQSGNNIGIGTATPMAQLDVQNSVAPANIAIRATNPNGTMMLIPNLGAGAYNNLAKAGDQGLIFYGTAPNAGNLVIGPWSGTGTPGIRMTAAGNVGIGTTAPKAKLEVNGTTQFDGAAVFSAGQTVIADVSAGGNLNLLQTPTGGAAGVVNLGGKSFIHACCGSKPNTFIGIFAGNFDTTGDNNTAIGIGALQFDTTGFGNTASGAAALEMNTTGIANTANGVEDLVNNTTGSYNTASGLQALVSNTTGNFNTANGTQALFESDTGDLNTAVGACALLNISVAMSTTTSCLSLPNLARSSGNTAVGAFAGQIYTDGKLNTYLGFSADSGSPTLSNATAIGACAEVSTSNSLVLGAPKGGGTICGSGTITANSMVGIDVSAPSNIFTVLQGGGHAIADGWDVYSSRRWKSNILPLQGALGKVERLRGVSYTYTASGKQDIGMIAEEVGRVVPEVVSYEDNGKDARGIDYARLTALLVEAVKQQQIEIKQEKSQIRRLEAKVRRLEASKADRIGLLAKPAKTAVPKTAQ